MANASLLIVGNVYHCCAEALLQILDLAAQGYSRVNVKRRHGLVKQYYIGIQNQRTRDGDTLLLTAGKIARLFIKVFGKPHYIEHFGRIGFCRRLPVFAYLQRILNVAEHGHVFEQSIILKHYSHIAVARRQSGDVSAVSVYNGAGGRLQKVR